MKKSFLFVFAASAAMLSLAGCTKGGGGGGKVEGKYNISISAKSTAADQAMLKLWKTAYEKLNPDVNIIVDGWGSLESSQEYVQHYALNRSEMTNIIYTTDDTTAYLALRNNFVDLRKYYEASADTDYTKYYETMLHTTSFNGEFRPTTTYSGKFESKNGKSDQAQYGIYFAPREYNMPGMVLNLDLFTELDVEVPDFNWTYDDFVDKIQEISDKIDEAKKTQTKYSVFKAIELLQTWEPIYTSIFKHLGGDGLFKFDDVGDASSNLGSTANKTVYNKIVTDFGNNLYPNAIDQDSSSIDFKANTVFMTNVSYPEIANFIDTVPHLKFLPFPTEYVAAGCGGYGILTDKVDEVQTVNGVSKKTGDLCWDFLKFIISKDGQNIAGKEGYIQPILKELATTGDWLKSFDEKLDHTAFCNGKELALDTYTFAAPKSRTSLRNDVSEFLFKLFKPGMSNAEISSLIDTTNTKITESLKIK